MTREQRLARLFRALSGDTQEEFGEEIGASRTLISQIENGEVVAGPEYLEAMARRAGITIADGEQHLRLYETQRRARLRWGRAANDLFDWMAAGLRSQAETAYQRLLTLPLPEKLPKAEDRERAEKLFARLESLTEEARLVVVDVADEYQTWALCERVCMASVEAASRDLDAAAAWARFATEIAARVRGPEGFRNRIQGFAAAHGANLLRVAGELKAADAAFAEAKRLWLSGVVGGLPYRVRTWWMKSRATDQPMEASRTGSEGSPIALAVKRTEVLSGLRTVARASETALAASARGRPPRVRA